MQQHDKIKQYTNSVCEQIRWKKAHGLISDELKNHITDQKNAFIAEGMDEETATDKAVIEMGDPYAVGTRLDRMHKPKTEWSLVILTAFMLLAGLMINFSDLYIFQKIAVTTSVGILCMTAAYFIDFSILGKYPKIIFFIPSAFLIATIPFTSKLNGAGFWIVIPLIGSIRPSVSLLLFPVAYAGIIYNMRTKGYLGLFLCFVFYAVPVLLLLNTRCLSNITLYTLTCLILLTLSIYKGWFEIKRKIGLMIIFIPLGLFMLVMFSIYEPGVLFRLERAIFFFKSFFAPEYQYDYGWGYNISVIRDTLMGAKLFGQGSLQFFKTDSLIGFLPNVNTDYLMTYFIHRAGWVPFAAVLSLLLGFIARGFYLCSKQKSILGRLVSTSVLLTISSQMVIYIASNLGFQFFTQDSLPFISYGGMSSIVNLFLFGILLSVFKSGDLMRDNKKAAISKNKFFEIIDGKIIIDLNLHRT